MNILIIIGTRPEAIKLSPLINSLQDSKFNPITVCTGQHVEPVLEVLDTFNINHDILLTQKKERTLTTLSANLLNQIEEVVKKYNPIGIVVQGDTTSVAMGSLVGFYNKIPVIHIEAGLRSGYIDSPYPEEFNRKLVSLISKFNFTTTSFATENLRKEGISEDTIFQCGNTLKDAFENISKTKNIHRNTGSTNNKIIVTCHRRENWGENLKNICIGLKKLDLDKIDVYFFTHPNPAVKDIVDTVLKNTKVKIFTAMGYKDFVNHLLDAKLIVTDSGGIQEEALIMGVPTIVIRDSTERPEGLIENGGPLKLVGNNTVLMIEEIIKLIDDENYYNERTKKNNTIYGKSPSKDIVKILEDMLVVHS